MVIVDWSDYEQLGSEELAAAPGVCSPGSGILEIYVSQLPERDLWTKTHTSEAGWTGYRQIAPDTVLGSPAAIAPHPRSRHVFVRGTDGHLWEKVYDTNIGWADYSLLDSNLLINSAPSVCSRWAGYLDVFTRAARDHSLWTMAFDGHAWRPAQQLGAEQLNAAPAAVSRGNGQIDVFVQGTDSALWYKAFDRHTWSAYTRISPEPFSQSPGACTRGPNSLDVFVQRDVDEGIWHKWYDGGWSEYEPIGSGPVASSPAVLWADGQIHIFALSRRGTLLHKVGTPVPDDSTQKDWRWCDRCQGLFFGGGQASSRCPEGGPHAAPAQSGSGDYCLPFGVQASPHRQSDWRWCDRCQGLFFGGGQASSRCPAGGPHAAPAQSGSGDYCLPFGVQPSPHRQSDWRWCNRCQGLFFGGGHASSRCPEGGPHAAPAQSGSGDYCLPFVRA